jgi:hypothetical protein
MVFTPLYVVLVGAILATLWITQELGGGWRWAVAAPVFGLLAYTAVLLIKSDGGMGHQQFPTASGPYENRPLLLLVRFEINHPRINRVLSIVTVIVLLAALFLLFHLVREAIPIAHYV